jgi:lipid A 3-O-deacylase
LQREMASRGIGGWFGMSPLLARGRSSGAAFFARALAITSAVAITSLPVIAADLPPVAAGDVDDALAPWFRITEIRGGVLAANLDGGNSEDAKTLINAEILFGQLNRERHYENPILEQFLHPRVHVGTSLSVEQGGTNQVYAGLTWDYRLTDRLFFESTFGGTVHDGPTSGNDTNSYGCSVLFRESAGIGFDITEHLTVLATVDHMSNAGLCDQNQGLTNAGVKLGYRW